MEWSCQISNEGVLYILFYIRRFAHWPILETKMRGALLHCSVLLLQLR